MSIRYSQDFKGSLVKLHQEGLSLKSLAEEFGPIHIRLNSVEQMRIQMD
ncbi:MULTISPECIES: hypothetical protein [Leuconostoc]|nr:hypothetical protein [Leuconostoc lactis]MDI6496862.1 hypothetical protein [Leuconostoc lactis]